MRIINFKRTIIYLVFSILLWAVLFISFGRTVYANEYIRYQSVDSDALAEWIKYKNEHEEQNDTTVYVQTSGSKNESNNKSDFTYYRIFPILFFLVIFAANILWLYFKKATSESSESYEIDIDPTDDDYTIDLTNDDYKIEDSVEETDLIDISLVPVQNKVMSEHEKIESAVEEETLEEAIEFVQPEELIESVQPKVVIESVQPEAVIEVSQPEEIIEPIQIEYITEPELSLTEEETIKELSSRELKEIVKNLDTIEKSKFMTPAKNGKKDEAIEICKEVTGLDQNNAEKIINLKLYY